MSDRLSNADLDRLEALAEGATPGPWISTWDAADGWHSITGAGSEDGDGYYLVCPEVATCEEGGSEDAEFIAASRTALPALLAEVREHRARGVRHEYAVARPASMPDMSGRERYTLIVGATFPTWEQADNARCRVPALREHPAVIVSRIAPGSDWEAVTGDDCVDA